MAQAVLPTVYRLLLTASHPWPLVVSVLSPAPLLFLLLLLTLQSHQQTAIALSKDATHGTSLFSTRAESGAVSSAGSLVEEHDAGSASNHLKDGKQASGRFTPLPPVWPQTFKINFFEEMYYPFVTFESDGVLYYDYASQRQRIDRTNGRGDRYCGTAMPFQDTPCTHLVVEGMRYLLFPQKKYCCKCCPASSGCGVVEPTWLSNATFLGQDFIYGQRCNKWNKPGLQNNFYWHSVSDAPVRILMEYTEEMTFDAYSYDKSGDIEDAIFKIPASLDCSVSCYGLCGVLSSQGGRSCQRKLLDTLVPPPLL